MGKIFIKIRYGKHTSITLPLYKFYKIPKSVNLIVGNAGSKKDRFNRFKENVWIQIKRQ